MWQMKWFRNALRKIRSKREVSVTEITAETEWQLGTDWLQALITRYNVYVVYWARSVHWGCLIHWDDKMTAVILAQIFFCCKLQMIAVNLIISLNYTRSLSIASHCTTAPFLLNSLVKPLVYVWQMKWFGNALRKIRSKRQVSVTEIIAETEWQLGTDWLQALITRHNVYVVYWGCLCSILGVSLIISLNYTRSSLIASYCTTAPFLLGNNFP